MDKKYAIKLINKQIDKLKLLEDPKYHSLDWRVQTITYIDTFFGPDSTQSKRIKDSPIGSQYSPDLTQFLNDCIETINDIGLYKKPKPNFLSHVDNLKIIGIAVAIFLAGLSSGIWLNDKKSFNLFSTTPNSTKNKIQHD